MSTGNKRGVGSYRESEGLEKILQAYFARTSQRVGLGHTKSGKHVWESNGLVLGWRDTGKTRKQDVGGRVRTENLRQAKGP